MTADTKALAPAIAVAGVLFSRAYGELVAWTEGRR